MSEVLEYVSFLQILATVADLGVRYLVYLIVKGFVCLYKAISKGC